jgi:[acyl-carrier-protein] S-malonyltransferase
MAAVLGDPNSLNEAIKNAAEGELLEAVNFNSPTQTAISGSLTAIERLKGIAREYRLKVIPLAVSTAFHSEAMAPASEKLAELIKSIDFCPPQIPIYMNMTGESLSKSSDATKTKDKDKECAVKLDIKNNIVNQVQSPVLWQRTIENIEKDIKPDIYIEFGPGSTLTGLIKKIVKGARVHNVATWEDILKYN